MFSNSLIITFWPPPPIIRSCIVWANAQVIAQILSFSRRNSPQWARASTFTRFLDHTQRRIIFGRTPLDKWLARHRDLYLTTHNTHNWQTYMPTVGFEPTISAGEWPQTHTWGRTANGTGSSDTTYLKTNVWLASCLTTNRLTFICVTKYYISVITKNTYWVKPIQFTSWQVFTVGS